MNKLQKSDGIFTTNQKEILEGQAMFYSDLYKSKSTINENYLLIYLDNIETPKLSIEEKNFCDCDLTIDECYDTLKTFSASKTPGNDGFSRVSWVPHTITVCLCFRSPVIICFVYSNE